MKPIAILEDPSIIPLPSYTATDVRRALEKTKDWYITLDLEGLQKLDRSLTDVLVLPYLDGDLSGVPLESILRFHKQGGGLIFLGDTPHVGRSFPYRNSQAPALRLTRCRDPLQILGLTDLGQQILGNLPDWESRINRSLTGVRTSAFPPDECHDLLLCAGGFKQLSPLVFIDRKHPDFLGAKAVVVGFDGGEPRENLMGVCELPWTFDPGLLDREWAGADVMVAQLVKAVSPPEVAFAIELEVVVPAHQAFPISLLARNLSDQPKEIILDFYNDEKSLLTKFDTTLAPNSCVSLVKMTCPAHEGPHDFSVTAFCENHTFTACRTQFGFLDIPNAPSLNLGFSIFRVFRSRAVDAAYQDFLRSTCKLGMQYVRMLVAWEDLEPEPEKYIWDVPDHLLAVAASEGIPAIFWVFPTARGSGLSEGGVPEWTLQEPSIDRNGKPGNFPCIWSPLYRKRYFAFLEALARRYANDPRLERFVFDFGNSDFAYTYHYYGDRGDLFDYSPHEQVAFARWLKQRRLPLDQLSRRWQMRFTDYSDIPIPFSEQTEAWLLYDEFRTWGVHQGIKEAVSIIHRIAPAKAPPDFPGHGLGSIADIGTYITHAQARHWDEVQKHPPDLVEAHNMGRKWGGEAWQVGGRFPDYDDSVFQSLRLESDYLTIPGPDLGVWENDIARIAMIRRSIAGAQRSRTRIGIMDDGAWNKWTSLSHIGARLDQPVDIISRTCRYDYAASYELVILPPDEIITTPAGMTSLLPLDEEYYEDLLDAVTRGLKLVVFPRTGLGDVLNPMRRILGLENVQYGKREFQKTRYSETWGNGTGEGFAATIEALPTDQVMLRNQDGFPLAIFRPHGLGGFILVGYDGLSDSFDGAIRYDSAPHLRDHTLSRLLQHYGIFPDHLRTGQACCYKECLFREDRDFLLFFSHADQPADIVVEFHTTRIPKEIWELSTGYRCTVSPSGQDGWFSFHLKLPPKKGLYFVIQ